ncbi:MAG: hypothetical protein K1X94_11100 [Sandaracinaceae bacterium]|nr:hypothetical protein [Sandaracinaceae bacterium]
MSFRALVLHALLALALASPVAAQVQDVEMPPSEVAARGHYLMGREHYEAARFDEAAREFQEAYDLSHRPQLFYNLFLAHRDAGHTRDAAAALRQYVEAVPDAPQIEVLRGRLAVLEAQVAEEDARERDARAEAQTSDALTTTTGTPASSATSAPSDANVGPWAVIGVGGALAVGAIVTGALAATTYGDISASCPDDRCPAGYDLDGRRSSGSALALTTDVLGGLAAATLAAGIVWEIVEATSHGEESRATLRCSPLGCRGHF